MNNKEELATNHFSNLHYPLCDFCVWYKDYGNGKAKRNFFAGIGWCYSLDEECLASNFCDNFKCALCKVKK